MKIISANVNGIRAANRKGFFQWLKQVNADVVCIQETKAQAHQLTDPAFHPEGYHCYYFDAERPGYSGVAIYTRQQPKKISTGLGWHCADTEGRYIQVDFDKLSVASLYMPSGSSKEERQLLKYEFMDQYEEILKAQRRKKREFIICGDWNIAHKKIDIKNWRGNQKNSGFLPEERAWMDKLFDEINYVDAFRAANQEADQYTWWSNRGQAWANNTGWRLDYQVVSSNMAGLATSCEIYKEERFSDHSPLIIDYD